VVNVFFGEIHPPSGRDGWKKVMRRRAVSDPAYCNAHRFVRDVPVQAGVAMRALCLQILVEHRAAHIDGGRLLAKLGSEPITCRHHRGV
jgi:hypothetical protein